MWCHPAEWDLWAVSLKCFSGPSFPAPFPGSSSCTAALLLPLQTHKHLFKISTLYLSLTFIYLRNTSSPSLRAGLGRASFRVSSGPPRRRRLLMWRFIARWSSVFVKLAFSWASMYFSRSRRISARAGPCAAGCTSPTEEFLLTSWRALSLVSSASRTSLISLSEDSTSVKTPERTAKANLEKNRISRIYGNYAKQLVREKSTS